MGWVVEGLLRVFDLATPTSCAHSACFAAVTSHFWVKGLEFRVQGLGFRV